MKFNFPTTIADPSELTSLGDAWFGTPGNDSLIWRKGSDTIDGSRGIDTLIIPALKGDAIIGNINQKIFQIFVDNDEFDPDLNISSANPRRFKISAIDIERLQFFDKTINIKTFSDKRRANRRERRQTVAANPRADAALARTPVSVNGFSGDQDPSSLAQNTPFCSATPDLF